MSVDAEGGARLAPLIAFDILPDGTIRPVDATAVAAAPGPGALWRWLHCDRTDPALPGWLSAHVPALAARALTEVETRPRCETLPDGLLLILRAMNLNPEQDAEDMVALRLWVRTGPDEGAAGGVVISTRHRRVFALDGLRAEMEAGRAPASPGSFVLRLCEAVTRRIESAATSHEETADEIEERLLDDSGSRRRPAGDERDIARLSRAAIKMRRYMAPQREALARLGQSETTALSEAERAGLRDVAQRTARAIEALDMVRERLNSLWLYVENAQASRIGRHGFVLSVVAAIFLPLSFLTGLFGMNLGGLPGASNPAAFATATGAMIALALGLLALFRWLRWF